jgi:hypothetical protein
MRFAYLKARTSIGGSRGGVSSNRRCNGDGDDYELEIGQEQNASPELLALCVHADEIMEFLEKCDSPIGGMILGGIKKQIKELKGSLYPDTLSNYVGVVVVQDSSLTNPSQAPD